MCKALLYSLVFCIVRMGKECLGGHMERLNTGYLGEQYKGLGIIEFKCYSIGFLFIDLIMFLIDSHHDLNEYFFICFYFS